MQCMLMEHSIHALLLLCTTHPWNTACVHYKSVTLKYGEGDWHGRVEGWMGNEGMREGKRRKAHYPHSLVL